MTSSFELHVNYRNHFDSSVRCKRQSMASLNQAYNPNFQKCLATQMDVMFKEVVHPPHKNMYLWSFSLKFVIHVSWWGCVQHCHLTVRRSLVRLVAGFCSVSASAPFNYSSFLPTVLTHAHSFKWAF